MKITRERQILLSLLLVGGAALGIDRLMGTPGASVAAPALSPSAVLSESAPPTTLPSPVAAAAPGPRRAPLAERLQRVAGDLTQTRSAFLIPSGWSTEVVRVISNVPAAPAEDVIGPFIASHRLEGTMVLCQEQIAIINGHTVAIGQSIDGFQLVRVDPQQAVLENGTAHATLRFKSPTLNTGTLTSGQAPRTSPIPP